METNEQLPCVEVLESSLSFETDPLSDKPPNTSCPPPTCTHAHYKLKLNNELCLAGLMGIIMLMAVYGVAWNNHVVAWTFWSLCGHSSSISVPSH